ncbi:MAG TPA: RDD family protein [Steroidobacteraceae bacterium]|nr:RDD family protein [Steroidobacteraceae bacterium]
MAGSLDNQYAPPKSAVADVGDEAASNLASRGARLAAVTIDGLLGFIGFMPAYVMNFATLTQHARNPVAAWIGIAKSGGWFYVGVLLALVVLAIDLRLLARNGQTIGKKLLGIKVVRVDGSPVTLFRVFFLRYVCNTFIQFVPLLGSLYALVDDLMIFGEKRRTVHDYIADTIVINA